LKARVTDQSSLRASPCVNLTVPPASKPAEATREPEWLSARSTTCLGEPVGWVVCQICGRRGRWVNPFPEVQHDSR
jgi:hypothetical protein